MSVYVRILCRVPKSVTVSKSADNIETCAIVVQETKQRKHDAMDKSLVIGELGQVMNLSKKVEEGLFV